MSELRIAKNHLWTPRPEVSIDNYQAVRDYYEKQFPNKNFARFAHWALGLLYKPDVHVPSYKTRIAIAKANQDKAQIFLLMNHWNRDDQFNDAVFLRRFRGTRSRIGRIVIMGEPSQFSEKDLAHKAQRIAIDQLGAFPVIRFKDGDGEEGSAERSKQHAASEDSLGLASVKVNRDRLDPALYPENERGEPIGADPTVVRPFRRGFRALYQAIDDPKRPVVVLPFAKFYGVGEDYNPHAPTMVAAEPITARMADVTELEGIAFNRLQAALTHAVDLRYHRQAA